MSDLTIPRIYNWKKSWIVPEILELNTYLKFKDYISFQGVFLEEILDAVDEIDSAIVQLKLAYFEINKSEYT